MAFRADNHHGKRKFQISNVVKAIWGIDIDNRVFPNLITVDTPYLERENRTEMTLDGRLYKNIAIPGMNRYMINDSGDIYTKRSGKFMIPKQDKDGYLCLSLYNTITGTRDNTRI